MRNLLSIILLTIVFMIPFTSRSLAGCLATGPDSVVCDSQEPNPDPDGVQLFANNNGVLVDVLPDGNIDTTNPFAIFIGNGDNEVNISRARIEGSQRAIQLGNGNDGVTVNDSHLIGASFVIDASLGDDNIEVNDSRITSTDAGFAIHLSNGNDTAVISRSRITGGPDSSFVIDGAAGMDDITIRDSYVISNSLFSTTVNLGNDNDKALIANSTIKILSDSFPVSGGNGDDEITLGGFGSDIPGGIDCDHINASDEGIDTLIFALEVPVDEIDELTQQIENLPTPDGSITINGYHYLYVRCERVVADLSEQVGRPIPTLSEWGLIAMAGFIGIVGLIAVRRKNKVTL